MPEPVDFYVVLDAEGKQIDERRQRRERAAPPAALTAAPAAAASPPQGPPTLSLDEALRASRKAAHKRQLVGLAFSGGGIRSATFNLGILQGLAALRLLKYFDYLSTVSGGGYIGAWLTAWIQRRATASSPPPSAADEVEHKLRPEQEQEAAAAQKDELDPIDHLRRHSNYLAPRLGFFSSDTWVLWAIYLRNFLLNQLVLLPALVIVLLVSRLVMFAYYPAVDDRQRLYSVDKHGDFVAFPLNESWLGILMFLIAASMAVALVQMLRGLHRVRQARQNRPHPIDPSWLRWWVVVPAVVGAWAFCPLIPNSAPWVLSDGSPWTLSGFVHGRYGWPPPPYTWTVDLAAFMFVAGVMIALLFSVISLAYGKSNGIIGWWCFLTGIAWGAMLYGVVQLIAWFYEWDGLEPWLSLQISATARMTTFGPPMLLMTMVLAISLAIGLIKDQMGEELREWLASLCAALMRAASAWAAVNLIALYGTVLVLWASPWVKAALCSGWFLTVALGVLAGGSAGTGTGRPVNVYQDRLARWSLPIFVVGILILVALLVHVVIDTEPTFDLTDDATSPSYLESDHPSSHISVTRTGEDGKVRLERKREYLRVTDEISAIKQHYWLGMLNTPKPGHQGNARLWFWLSNEDKAFLNNRLPPEIKLPHNQQKMESLRPRKRYTIESLGKALKDKNYPKIAEDEALQKRIIDHIQLTRVVLGGAGLVGSMSPDPSAHADVAFRLNEMTIFEFETTTLPESVARKEFHRHLERFEFKRFFIETFEDELDKVFPDGRDVGIKIVILQRVRGGLEPAVEIGSDAFLWKIGRWLSLCLLVLVLAASQVNVNAFSLHGLYLNRLVRAYLGASRKPEKTPSANPEERKPDPVTGFDPDDDLDLAKLRIVDNGYDGPLLIVNAALNLVHGDNLAWQERMAESFIFTSEYCGSETSKYRPTNDTRQRYAGGVKLGTAVTISGAAASPNMGYHSSPAITFLLTVFNARLGAWLGNPSHRDCWQDNGPRWGFLYLLQELFGLTDAKSKYVYLSDGGHFENLGTYELIKRRCRYVVVCDAGEDGLHRFEDLGNLIRKVRIDLGIRIEISLDSLQLQKDSRHTRWHCAIGKIRYDDADLDVSPGTLVYIKPSLTGEESADVLHYATSHPTFPHETTANQFFTESQFESYRELGQHIADKVFKQSVDDANEADKRFPPGPDKGEKRERWCDQLFASLDRRWLTMPPEYDANFVTSTYGYIDLQDAWRKDLRLWRLTLDVYPELDPKGKRSARLPESKQERAEREAAELHMLLQMVQVIENAYLSLNLEVHYAHPLNRGWMDVFHRWTSADTFRRHWPMLRSEFGRDFVRFCEREMRIGEVTGGAWNVDKLPVRLLHEFNQEWPEHKKELKDCLKGAAAKTAGTYVWAIYCVRAPRKPNDPEPSGMPSGLIAVWPDVAAGMPNRKGHMLLVWQRGAYRDTGLGWPALHEVLADLENIFTEPSRLRVHLPTADLTGPGGPLQKRIWLTFFQHARFSRDRDAEDRAGKGPTGVPMLIMQRDFK